VAISSGSPGPFREDAPVSGRLGRAVRSWRWPLAPAPAIFDLNNPAHYVHWHFFQMSVANVTVILLMIAVFVAAILLPFPGRGRAR
jgi:hypothetical protein